MFKTSARCRLPHVNVDNLRDDVSETRDVRIYNESVTLTHHDENMFVYYLFIVSHAQLGHFSRRILNGCK